MTNQKQYAEQKHTPEPWGVKGSESSFERDIVVNYHCLPIVVAAAFGGAGPDGHEENAEDNAARIVACINWMAGVSTERIEAALANGDAQLSRDMRNAAKEDELQAELERLRAQLAERESVEPAGIFDVYDGKDGTKSYIQLKPECADEASVKLYTHSAPKQQPAAVVDERQDAASFKNFHRSLCERFGYCHDEKDWRRDLVSLEEHIAKLNAQPAPAVPEGWKLVPVEPTGKMLMAGYQVGITCEECNFEVLTDTHVARLTYELMLDAAPEPKK